MVNFRTLFLIIALALGASVSARADGPGPPPGPIPGNDCPSGESVTGWPNYGLPFISHCGNGVATGLINTSTVGALAVYTGTTTISGFTPSGDVIFTSPNFTVTGLNSVPLGLTTATAGNILIGSGTDWVSNPISGDGTLSASGAFTLSSIISAGSCTLCSVTFDAKGRATAFSNGTGGITQLTGGVLAGPGSGSVVATLGNPGPSTLGGIESITSVTSKWISSISTLGVPVQTQPDFTDISGQATLGQLPSITGPAILGRVTSSLGAVSAAYTPSNSTDTILALVHGTVTSGHCVEFFDASGSLQDAGAVCSSGGGGGITQLTGGVLAGPGSGSQVATLGNPGPSTLGGIESIAAVTHEWVNSISTSGVPGLAQPAFTDISGSPSASQLETNFIAALTAQYPPVNGNCLVGNATPIWTVAVCPGGGGATITTNRITTGTTNTLASITNNFTTELWVSASTGAKTDNVPGCVSGLNNDYLIESDGEGNAGTYPVTVTPASGSIGAGSTFALSANSYAVIFQCDGPSTTWRVVASNQPGSTVRYNAGTSLTIGAGDNGNVISQSNSGAVSATIAQAGTTGFPEGGYYTVIQNTGAGAVTTTATTSTFNGSGNTFIIPGGTPASPTGALIYADNVGNYIDLLFGTGSSSAFSAITSSTNTTAAMVVGSGASISASGSGSITATAMAATGLTGTLAAAQFPALTGDVTTSAGSLATTIANNAVTNGKAAQMIANTMKGNFTSATTNASDIAMISCPDTGGNHYNYVTGNGMVCGNTNSGGSTVITLSPGLASIPGTYNAGAQTITNASTLSVQLYYKAEASSCTLNSTCNAPSTNDSALLPTFTASGQLLTLPAPGAPGTASYQSGYDGTHSYSVTTPSGTIYGACGLSGSTISGLTYQASFIPDGTNWQCSPSGAGGVVGSTVGTLMVSPGVSGTATGLAATSGNFAYVVGGSWTSASLTTILASPPAIGGTTPALGNFSTLELSGVKVPEIEQETASWVAGANPNNAILVADLPYAITLTSITARIKTAVGGTATITVWSAPSGTACGVGTNLASNSINANGTGATNQSLTLTTTSVAAGLSLCLQSTGTAWSAGSGAGGITARWNPT